MQLVNLLLISPAREIRRNFDLVFGYSKGTLQLFSFLLISVLFAASCDLPPERGFSIYILYPPTLLLLANCVVYRFVVVFFVRSCCIIKKKKLFIYFDYLPPYQSYCSYAPAIQYFPSGVA